MFAAIVIDPSGQSRLYELEAGSLVKARREAMQHLRPGSLLELWRFQHQKNWLVFVIRGTRQNLARFTRTSPGDESESTPAGPRPSA